MADSAEEFATALAEVLSQFGRRVVDRPDQLRGALSDTLGASAGEHRTTVDAVVVASRSGVAGEIRDSRDEAAADPAQIRAWFDQLVSAGVSLRDAALATRSWAEAFDAPETARVTSELSEQLFGADAGGAASSVGVVSSDVRTDPSPDSAPSPTRQVGIEDDATDLGDGSVIGALDADRTRLPARTPQVSDAPRSDVPATGATPDAVGRTAADAVGPTGSNHDVPDGRETADTTVGDSPLRRVAGWAPAIIAAIAIVIAPLVIVPQIQANQAETPYDPVTPAVITGIGEPMAAAAPLLTRTEMLAMLLSAADLAAAVPAATDTYEAYDADPWALLVSISTPGCEPALNLATAGEELYRSFAGIQGEPGAWAQVYSSGQRYTSVEGAAAAFNALGFSVDCSRATMVEPGSSVPVRIAQAAGTVGDTSVLRTVVARDDGDAFLFQRDCYLRANVVACYVSAGYKTGRISDAWLGEGRSAILDAKATTPITSAFEVIP